MPLDELRASRVNKPGERELKCACVYLSDFRFQVERGCYVVDNATGARIHPPKCGEKYRKWLEHWQPKGKPQ